MFIFINKLKQHPRQDSAIFSLPNLNDMLGQMFTQSTMLLTVTMVTQACIHQIILTINSHLIMIWI